MTSRTTDGFWKCYKEVPEDIKKEACKAYKNFKKTHTTPDFISKKYIQPDQSSPSELPKTIGLSALNKTSI